MARPKEFERGEALDKALNVFWQKGYEGASVAELLEAMGLSRSSLYETFGDKESLFGEALAHYRDKVRTDAITIFDSAPTVREGLRRFFRNKIDRMACPETPTGCLLTNTACASPDDAAAAAVVESSAKFEDAFFALLERGKANGELSADADTRRLARLMVAVTYGMNVLSRLRPDAAVLNDVAESALSSLDG